MYGSILKHFLVRYGLPPGHTQRTGHYRFLYNDAMFFRLHAGAPILTTRHSLNDSF